MLEDRVRAPVTGREVSLAIGVVGGTGEGPTALAAFDAALRDAGIANFNLIRLSSVIPAGTRIDVDHAASPPEGSWGDRLYVVMAELRAERPGEEVWAGIGWVQDESGKGLFVEHEGHSRAEVESDIEASLRSLCAGRPDTFGPIQMRVQGARCVDAPVCALVVASYESEPWTGPTLELDAPAHRAAPAGNLADVELVADAQAAPFAEFDPGEYLREYYATVGSENARLLAFLVEAFREVPDGASMLEFGIGPTVYQLIAAAPRVGFIDVADALPVNLDTIDAWRNGEPGAFEWSPFIRRTLALEGHLAAREIEDREHLMRERIRHLLHCDALDADPLLGKGRPYDVVGSHFVAESITADRSQWYRALANISTLVAPGGRLVLSALEGAHAWRVGNRTFPAVPLSVDDVVETLLTLGFLPSIVDRVDAETLDLTGDDGAGYSGLIFVSARKDHPRRTGNGNGVSNGHGRH